MSTGMSSAATNTVAKCCWVCFGTEEDDEYQSWVHPCRCKGTTKWVHHECLMRWIDEKQKGHFFTKVSCPQCNYEYKIVFPKFGKLGQIIQQVDRLLYKGSPLAATGVLIGSLYWTAVTYGAVTVMQVLGHKEGLEMMERADPLFLLVGLPTIPVGLVLGRMVPWDEFVLRTFRRNAHLLTIFHNLFEGENANQRPRLPPAPEQALRREIKFTRLFCGAMLFPTMATIVGKLAFRKINSNLQRSVLGGITFIVVKGMFKLYHKYQIQSRMAHRQVQPYCQETDDGQ